MGYFGKIMLDIFRRPREETPAASPPIPSIFQLQIGQEIQLQKFKIQVVLPDPEEQRLGGFVKVKTIHPGSPDGPHGTMWLNTVGQCLRIDGQVFRMVLPPEYTDGEFLEGR